MTTTEADLRSEKAFLAAKEKNERLYNRIKIKLATLGFPIRYAWLNEIGSDGAMDFKQLFLAIEPIIFANLENKWAHPYFVTAHELGHGKYHPITPGESESLLKTVIKIVGDDKRSHQILNVYSDSLVNFALFANPIIRDDYETGGLPEGWVKLTSEIIDNFLCELGRYLYHVKKKNKDEIYKILPRLKNVKWRPLLFEWLKTMEGDKIIEDPPNGVENEAWKICPWHNPLYIFFLYLNYLIFLDVKRENIKNFLKEEDTIIWWKELVGTDIDNDLLECHELLHHHARAIKGTKEQKENFEKIIRFFLKYDDILPKNFDCLDRGIIKCTHCNYMDIDTSFTHSGWNKLDIETGEISAEITCPECKKKFELLRKLNFEKIQRRCHICGEPKHAKLTSIDRTRESYFILHYECGTCNSTFQVAHPFFVGARCPYCNRHSEFPHWSDIMHERESTNIRKIKNITPSPPGYELYAQFYCTRCETSTGELIKPIGKIEKVEIENDTERLFGWFD